MVSTLPFADAVYFLANASDTVNITSSAKKGSLVFNCRDVVEVDKTNFIHSYLNFWIYYSYSSIFRLKWVLWVLWARFRVEHVQQCEEQLHVHLCKTARHSITLKARHSAEWIDLSWFCTYVWTGKIHLSCFMTDHYWATICYMIYVQELISHLWVLYRSGNKCCDNT